jgi:hypothetical protein
MMKSPRVPDALLALAARRRATGYEPRQPLYLPSFQEFFREAAAERAASEAAELDDLTSGDDEDDDFY